MSMPNKMAISDFWYYVILTPKFLRTNFFFNPRSDGVWRVTRPDGGWPKGPPLRIFKSKSRRVKTQTALERSRRTLQDTIMLTLFSVTSQEGQKGQNVLIYSSQQFVT